jgi:endonuclease III
LRAGTGSPRLAFSIAMEGHPTRRRIVEALLDRHGRSFCADLGIAIERNTPSPLFRWLCASILFSARISSDLAARAARALGEHGLTTPQRMADATWAERTRILNKAGYARYDESTSRMLGDTAALLIERYRGDLRRLRARAGHDPMAERRLLQEFKGIGETGADIFCREVQGVWPELYPFADRKALAAAQKLGLGDDAGDLARLVDQRDFPRLVAALIRTSLAVDYDSIIEQACAPAAKAG